MINRISIKGIASYSNEVAQEIINLKRINCFYGLNGSGKSTIAKYLQEPNELDYAFCSMTPIHNNEEIFVYNQKFVKDNFWDSKEQVGVFTVNEENVEAEKAIEVAEQEISVFKDEQEKLKEKANEVKKQKENLYTELEKKVWKEKDNFIKTPLAFCLEGKQRKNLFLDAVKNADEASPKITIENLFEQAIELEKPDIKPKQSLPLLAFSGTSIERDTVNTEMIVGSSESYLSGLIEKVGNSDWVRDGVEHYQNSEGVCPFCQETPVDDFESNLKALFDATYRQKCSQVENNIKAYEQAINSLETSFSSEVFNDSYVVESADFAVAKAELVDCCKTNVALLREKETKPSNVVELSSTDVYIQKLNCCIEIINSKVADFNSRISSKPKIKAKIKTQFWQIHKRTYKTEIELTNNNVKTLDTDLDTLREQYRKKTEEITEQQNIVVEQRKHTTNINTAIQNIKNTLTSVGVDDFHIDKVDGSEALYRIVRKNSTADNVYGTLSEGEKTLITYLYFLEQCKGLLDPDSPLGVTDKVIVIDDPVSSLSHNFVYEIATLIQKEIIKKSFKQVFLFTHNLFFFHEMMNQAGLKKDDFEQAYSLYRVSKNDHSKISILKKNDIRNDYDGFWQVIRDAEKDKAWSPSLPNAMRNVLEHFFAFVHKRDRLSDELTNLGDEHNNFRPLLRYISKGSHSDLVNLTDFGDIDVVRFLSIFKQVFIRTDYEDHYKTMIR
jgi:wobble nucleotide-excising tRNase